MRHHQQFERNCITLDLDHAFHLGRKHDQASAVFLYMPLSFAIAWST